MTTKPRALGFVGLGIMGTPMAGHLIAAGHTVHLFSRSNVPEALVSAGGKAAPSGKGVAQNADVVFLMVPDTPHVESALFVGRDDRAIVPVRAPVSAARAAIEKADLDRVRGIGPVEHRRAALIESLHHDVASGHGNQRTIVRGANLFGGLRRRHLVVALELELPVGKGEDGIRTPFHFVGGAAFGLASTTPFVGEQELGAVVIEGRRMPVGKIGVGHGRYPNRVCRILDVDRIY